MATGIPGPTLPSSGNRLIDAVFNRLVQWLMLVPMQGHLNSDLASISELTPTDGNIIVGDGTDWVAESGATARTSLGVAIGTDVQAFDADLSAIAALATSGMLARTGAGTAATRTITAGDNITVTNGDGVAGNPTVAVTANVFQPLDAQLTDIAGLAVTDGNFIVGNGTNFVAESGATARASLGLGTIATQDASNVTITGGSISGITDLAVADGGTGASDAATARGNLDTFEDVFTTRGDILRAGVGGAEERLALGASGTVLTSDGTDAAWATPAPTAAQTSYDNATSGLAATDVQAAVDELAETIALETTISQLAIATATQTKITGYSVAASNLGDATFATGTLTIGAATAGWWMIVGDLRVSNAIDRVFARIFKNGAKVFEASAIGASGQNSSANVVALLNLASTDTIELYIYHTHGSTQSCSGRMSAIRHGG